MGSEWFSGGGMTPAGGRLSVGRLVSDDCLRTLGLYESLFYAEDGPRSQGPSSSHGAISGKGQPPLSSATFSFSQRSPPLFTFVSDTQSSSVGSPRKNRGITEPVTPASWSTSSWTSPLTTL